MSDPRGNWDLVETVAGVVRLTRVVYGGGLWVAMGIGAASEAYIATATTPDGPWTVYGGIGIPEAYDLVYGDGYWVAGAAVTSTDPTSSWTLHTGLPETFGNVAFDGMTWGAVSADGGKVYSATDPSGSWTEESDISSFIAEGSTILPYIAYLDGEWILFVNSSTEGFARILTASSLAGLWTERASFDGLPGDTINPWQIRQTDEGYYIHTYYAVWYAPTLDGTWTAITDIFDWVAYGNGEYVWIQGGDLSVSDTVDGDLEVIGAAPPGYIWTATYADDTWVGVGDSDGDGAVWVAGEGGDGWGLLL